MLLRVALCAAACLLHGGQGFRLLGGGGSRAPYSSSRLILRMDSLSEMRAKMAEGDYVSALQQLKRNPMLTITDEDARAFLNNLSKLVPESEAASNLAAYQNKMIETSSFVYKRCERQNVFRGFGSAEADAYPLSSMNEVSPQRLEDLTGLNIAALTPKQRTLYWQGAGIAVCAAEYFLGTSLGIDPLYTLIPGTLAALAVDQIFYKGAFAESVYQTLFPEYKQKVIYHEAGHFLLAYLLGIPVRGIVTNAMEARKYPDIRGSAGTIFFDTKLAEEMEAQKVTRGSIDRLSIVIMAGIAAEALKFDRAEGGVSDEQSLTGFLTSVQPPWSITRIQAQARWSVSQAILLIREHQQSYDALVECLQEGKGVGDAVLAIEAHLPQELPTSLRVQERGNKRKKRETEALLRFVQRRTYLAGGIAAEPWAGGAGPDALSAATAADNAPFSTPAAPSPEEQSRQKIDAFAERMRLLETAVKRKDLDVEKLTSGGIWLNDLRTLGAKAEGAEGAEGVETVQGAKGPGAEDEASAGFVVGRRIVLPPPLPGFEAAVERLALQDGLLPSAPAAGQGEGDGVDGELSAAELLQSHRGYQTKELERAQADARQKAVALYERLRTLQRETVGAER